MEEDDHIRYSMSSIHKTQDLELERRVRVGKNINNLFLINQPFLDMIMTPNYDTAER